MDTSCSSIYSKFKATNSIKNITDHAGNPFIKIIISRAYATGILYLDLEDPENIGMYQDGMREKSQALIRLYNVLNNVIDKTFTIKFCPKKRQLTVTYETGVTGYIKISLNYERSDQQLKLISMSTSNEENAKYLLQRLCVDINVGYGRVHIARVENICISTIVSCTKLPERQNLEELMTRFKVYDLGYTYMDNSALQPCIRIEKAWLNVRIFATGNILVNGCPDRQHHVNIIRDICNVLYNQP